jgi:hypothetical protein
MAQALPQMDQGQQLALHDGWTSGERGARLRRSGVAAPASRTVLCAGCREKEARYGFRDEEDDPTRERPRTLCFSCFRVELTRRQVVKARLARGWNAQQVSLPLEETLKQLTHRRRQAQIAARRALGL